MTASQEESRNTFLAQPDRNPRAQHPGSTSGGPQQEQAKAITILRSGHTIGIEEAPPTPFGENDGDEVESLTEQDQLEVEVDDGKEEEGTKDEPIIVDSTSGEFTRRPGKKLVIEEVMTKPLLALFP